MTVFISPIFLIFSLFILYHLALIDLRLKILPDSLVLRFLLSGLAFHLCTQFFFISLREIFFGALMGGGLLFSIRIIANYYYKCDTLGLGDVKLMLAAGVWLGPEDVLIALCTGALISALHGIAYAYILSRSTQSKITLNNLYVPAGPGFICGIIVTGVIKFHTLPSILF